MSASEALMTSLKVLTAPSTSQDESKSRRLAYLNALVKIWQKRDPESIETLRLQEVMLWQVFREITVSQIQTVRGFENFNPKFGKIEIWTRLRVKHLSFGTFGAT